MYARNGSHLTIFQSKPRSQTSSLVARRVPTSVPQSVFHRQLSGRRHIPGHMPTVGRRLLIEHRWAPDGGMLLGSLKYLRRFLDVRLYVWLELFHHRKNRFRRLARPDIGYNKTFSISCQCAGLGRPRGGLIAATPWCLEGITFLSGPFSFLIPLTLSSYFISRFNIW